MTARRRLVLSLGVLATVFWIGVMGYLVVAPDITLLDAVYMVTITLSTVGYREAIPLTPAVQTWTIVVIMVGSVSMAVMIASIAGILWEGQLGRFFGSRKLESQIKKLNDHTIVCGYGRMGQLLVDSLVAKGVSLVVIEKDPDRLRGLQETSRPHVAGDATEERVLQAAGLERCKNLVAALANDADNLFVAMTARQLRSDLYIVARAEDPATPAKLRRAGADRVISPQHIGAEWIANVLTRPHVTDFVDMAAKGRELEMAQVEVGPDSPLANKSLREADIRKRAELIVVAIRRPDGTTRFNPGADEIIHPGDLLITVGQAGAASQLSQPRLAEPVSDA